MSEKITVEVEVDPYEVLKEVSVEDLKAELNVRSEEDFDEQKEGVAEKVERVFLHYRHGTDAPDCVRALVYDVLGRVL